MRHVADHGRTLALLGLLQSRREWAGAELRERLEVSDRTLRRDIEDLRDLGYGIAATRGVGGGYRFGAGAAVPPLTLSPDEAVAIAVGLRAAAAGQVTGMEDAAARVLAKVEQALAPPTRRRIADVEQAMVPLETARGDVDMATVAGLAAAIGEHRRVRLTYRRADGQRSERTLEPYRILHRARRWYLVAHDPGSGAWRTLRIDRIEAVGALPDTFTAQEVPDEALRRLTTRAISTTPYPVLARIRVRAPADQVRAVFGPTVADVLDQDDGTTLLVTGARRPEEIVLYLATSGLPWELIEGEQVRATLRRLSAELAAAAEPPPATVRSPGSSQG